MAANLEVKNSFKVYENIESLPADYRQLVIAAQDATGNAYAPYSRFKVGASVLLNDGEIVIGSNQENAAFPSGLCAERVAIFYSSSNYSDTPIKAVAVVASKENVWRAAMPCGACRQVIREQEIKQKKPIKIIMAYKDGKYLIANSAKDLLPLSFTKKDL